MKVIQFSLALTAITSRKYATWPVDAARTELFYFVQPSILAHPVQSQIKNLLPVAVNGSVVLQAEVRAGIGAIPQDGICGNRRQLG